MIYRYIRKLFESRALRKQPIPFIYRSVIWLVHILTGRYAIYEDSDRDIRMILAPFLYGKGSTNIFISRRYYEPAFENLEKLISPGSVTIDCGANAGIYTLAAAALSGPSGLVIAVEPQSYAIRAIHRSAFASGLTNIIAVSAAVSDGDGEAELDVSNTAVEASIVWRAAKPSLLRVPAVTLDSLVRDHNLTRVDLIKLDIEGAEFLALLGGAFDYRTFQARHITRGLG